MVHTERKRKGLRTQLEVCLVTVKIARSRDEVIKKKLKPGKFVFTPAGIIKILGVVCLLAAITFFLASSACDEEALWRPNLFLISNAITIFVTAVLFFVFSFGFTVKDPWLWVKTDILLNVAFPIISIVCSTVATWPCRSRNQLHKLPEPFAIAGGVVLIVSAAALALLFRFKEDEPKDETTPEQNTAAGSSQTEEPESRKSIFA